MASTEGESSTVPSADVPDLKMQERLYALNHTMASTEGESSTVPSADVPDLTMQERLYALNHTMASTEGESSTVPSADVPDLTMQERLTKMRKNLHKSIDAYAVILVLLASITYIGFLQPPGSFDEGGLVGTSSRLRSFVYCNSFSFFSITDLLLCVSGNPDLNTEKTNDLAPSARSVVYRLMKLLGINLLFVVSLTCCMGAYISAGTVVQKLNIADQEIILISSIIGSSLYIVFILLLLFLFTFPTLKFFSTCCKHGSSGGDGSQSQCWPWKNPCKGYLKKLEDKLLHNAPNLSQQQTATTPIEPSVGGDASGSTPIVQDIELVQTEQQRIGWCVNKYYSLEI
ncbi:unnamed protein product [Sphagnum troendelagicum]|uniref:PGG domain-containing protein n=1 Tax=Sphagnum troendelagicum TaxID=128251 RepID=A0ABP0TUS8_9BRYO